MEVNRPQELVAQFSGRLKVSKKVKKIGNEHEGKRITSRKDTMNQNKFRPGLKKDQEQNVFIKHPSSHNSRYQPQEGASSILSRKEHLTSTLLQEHHWGSWIAFRTTREKPDSTIISLTQVYSSLPYSAIGFILTNPAKGGVKRDNSWEMIASWKQLYTKHNPQNGQNLLTSV